MQILVNGLLGAIGIVPLALAFAAVHVPARVVHIALASNGDRAIQMDNSEA